MNQIGSIRMALNATPAELRALERQAYPDRQEVQPQQATPAILASMGLGINHG